MAGADAITASAGNDFVFAVLGSDFVSGSTGDDTVYADCELRFVSSQFPFDVLFEAENLILSGANWGGVKETSGTGDAYLRKDAGNAFSDDTVEGGEGNDWIDGGSGDDSISGGTENDTLRGGAGSDTLSGGESNDILDPGARGAENNFDVLTGGSGADVFFLRGGSSDVDEELTAQFVIALGAQDAGVDASSDFQEFITDLVRDAAPTIVSGVSGANLNLGPAGAVVNPLISGLVSEFFTVFEDEDTTPISADIVFVTDFDPEHDQLALAIVDNASLRSTAGTFFLPDGRAKVGLEFTYQLDVADNTLQTAPFARVFLDDGYLDRSG